MSKPLVLAIDQGTTSSRAFVFDADARVVATAQEEFQQHFPRPGWVEHDPEDIWRSVVATATSAIARAEASGDRIAAIGIANQRETTVAWDRKSLKPIGRAIVWQDRRTADVCQRLRADGAETDVSEKTGLLLDPYFSATKIARLLDDHGAREAAGNGDVVVGTIDSFLLARLTGGAHATDATNASRTSLFNIRTNEWDAELLRLFNVPAACLPVVRDNVANYGEARADLFGRPIPVRGMVGDQQAAAIGQACFAPGQVKSTYGTGCFVLTQTGEDIVRSTNRLLTTIARRIDGRTSYALEGSIFVAGAAVKWLRDELGAIDDASDTEAIASQLDDAGGVYFVPAFAGLGAPHWDAEARGAILGLTRGTGRAHIVRAALEATAYQTADLLGAMASDGARVQSLKVDGGMVANDWLMRFLADICDTVVERPQMLETTALGAALLAGVGAGVYDDLDAAGKARKVDATFKPTMDADARQLALAGWHDAINRVRTK
ncbi:MAG: glycerol kinase GlpK [Alphaproteobacteria bacterium]|nr:glycerol kinase GlpK [Alphaproteobacteria bacterium]